MKVCEIKNCDQPATRTKHTICERHYRRRYRTGSYEKKLPESTGTCFQCHTPLSDRKYGAIFCSQRCATRHHRNVTEAPIQCPLCDTKRQARSDATYCSKKCARKAGQLNHHYGLSVIQYRELLTHFDNKCYICDTTTNLHIDHCHNTQVVRGLLCGNCNIGIGNFQNSPELLRNAISYLHEHHDGWSKQT